MQPSSHAKAKSGLSLLQGLALLCVMGTAMADIDISQVSGTPNHGETLTISGQGFGTKPQADPLIFDDFEDHTIGDEIGSAYDTDENGWGIYRYNAGGTPPYIDDSIAYGQGTKSVRKDLTDTENFKGLYWAGFNGSDEAYVSLYFYWDTVSGKSPTDGVYKWTRLNAGYNPDHVYSSYQDGHPSFPQQAQPHSSDDGGWFYEKYNDGEGVTSSITSPYSGLDWPQRGEWHRMEVYWKLHHTNGIARTWVDLNISLDEANVSTRALSTSAPVYSVLMPLMASTLGEQLTKYVDDVYIDNTRARVEIGNAPRWSESTTREVQLPFEWSESSIRLNINKGSLEDLQNSYLYVVDAKGNVNEQGFPLSKMSAPNPPTDLRVR